MPHIVNIETRQHKKEHFVYIGDEKIAVHPLGPDMSAYANVPGVTIYALRGWYYIPLSDKDKGSALMWNAAHPDSSADQQQPDIKKGSDPELAPRKTRLGF